MGRKPQEEEDSDWQLDNYEEDQLAVSDSDPEFVADLKTGARRNQSKKQQNVCDSDESDDDCRAEDIDLSKLTPESLRRAKRRIANRECARRIRQRRLDLVDDLTSRINQLKEVNSTLMHGLAGIVSYWRDARANRHIKSITTKEEENEAAQQQQQKPTHDKGDVSDDQLGGLLNIQHLENDDKLNALLQV